MHIRYQAHPLSSLAWVVSDQVRFLAQLDQAGPGRMIHCHGGAPGQVKLLLWPAGQLAGGHHGIYSIFQTLSVLSQCPDCSVCSLAGASCKSPTQTTAVPTTTSSVSPYDCLAGLEHDWSRCRCFHDRQWLLLIHCPATVGLEGDDLIWSCSLADSEIIET